MALNQEFYQRQLTLLIENIWNLAHVCRRDVIPAYVITKSVISRFRSDAVVVFSSLSYITIRLMVTT